MLMEYAARKSNTTSLLLTLCPGYKLFTPNFKSAYLSLLLSLYHYHYFYLSSLLKANTVTGMYVLFLCTKTILPNI